MSIAEAQAILDTALVFHTAMWTSGNRSQLIYRTRLTPAEAARKLNAERTQCDFMYGVSYEAGHDLGDGRVAVIRTSYPSCD